MELKSDGFVALREAASALSDIINADPPYTREELERLFVPVWNDIMTVLDAAREETP